MKKTIQLLIFLLTIVIANAQEIDESKNFIYKNDASILYGDNISYETPFLKENYFKLDSLTIMSNDVKFYKSGNFFYGRTPNNESSFASRIIKGKINYFVITNPSFSNPITTGGGFGRIGYGSTESYYYNTGFNSLKPANYENLSIDLKDNLESINYLNMYKNAKKKRTVAYVVGGIAMFAGILTSGKKTGKTTTSINPLTGGLETTDETELRPLNLTIGLAGFGTLVATVLSSKKKKQYIRKAIEVYNEN